VKYLGSPPAGIGLSAQQKSQIDGSSPFGLPSLTQLAHNLREGVDITNVERVATMGETAAANPATLAG
jgi:hypothetical protein